MNQRELDFEDAPKYKGMEHRAAKRHFTEEEYADIEEHLYNSMYKQVGKGTVKLILYIGGPFCLLAYLYLKNKLS